MYADPENVLISTSPYTTLLYLLANDMDSIKSSAFFFIRNIRPYSDTEKEYIRTVAPNSYFIYAPAVKPMFRNIAILRKGFTFLQLVAKMFSPSYWSLMLRKYHRWPFLKTAKIWAYDGYPSSRALIGRRNYTFIEEGISNYKDAEKYSRMSAGMRAMNFLQAPFAITGLASTPQATKIILTGLAQPPECFRNKNVEIISPQKLWDESSDEKREYIMRLFGLLPSDIDALKGRDIIFVQQPFSEDGFMTRDEQAEMMRRILVRYDPSRVVIKTHYHNTVNYRELFPGVAVLDKVIPMELLTLCGVKFKRAVTVNSTAVLSFPGDVKIDWLGSNSDDECFGHLCTTSREKFTKFLAGISKPAQIDT